MIKLERSILNGLTHNDPTATVVRAALQRAIELELATIPLYLYALYSLKPKRNIEISDVLKSVVIEEMLHMVLVSNILNALGGGPALAAPHLMPHYPGRLPGGVEQHLTVHLSPFSLEQLEVFIEIEEPRDPIDHESLLGTDVDEPCTIGEFYALIRRGLLRVDPSVFVSPPRHQVGPDLVFGAVEVVDAATAAAAIDIIIAQGEGTATSPEEVAGFGAVNDFAHFYRFLEIKKGRRLVQRIVDTVQVGYDYAGDPIIFDPDGVHDLAKDPMSSDFSPGSRERFLLETFNFTYTSLLRRLELLLNGRNDAVTFSVVLDLMNSLTEQAQNLTSGDATTCPLGPTFEYQLFAPTTDLSDGAIS